MALLVAPLQTMPLNIEAIFGDADLKLPAIGKSGNALDAKVTKPTLSRFSANLSAKLVAAAFRGPHEPDDCSEPERSTTITTLTSFRTAVAAAFTVTLLSVNQCKK